MIEHIDLSKFPAFKALDSDGHVPGFVYFMGRIGEIKIGMSVNFYFRIGQLANDLDYIPEIFHLIFTSDMRLLESQYHKHYKPKNMHGEWFNLTKEDIEYIRKFNGETEEMLKLEREAAAKGDELPF